MNIVDDPFLDVNGRPMTVAGIKAERPASYQEIPAQDVPAMRGLADAVVRRVWGVRDPADPTHWLVRPMSPWRQYVTQALLPADVTKYALGRGGSPTGDDPFTDLSGPSGQVAAFLLRSDHLSVSPPADIVWTGTARVTPRETIALSTISTDRLNDGFTISGIGPDGTLITERTFLDPSIVNELADAFVRSDNSEFVNGAATATDPIRGVVNFTGITTQAATGSGGYIDDVLDAIFALRVLKRSPNVAFIPQSLAKLWRKAKDSTGNYLFPQNAPMQLDNVPVVGLDGIAPGASTFALVGDFTWVRVLHRLLPNGRLVQVAKSDDGATNFSTFQTTFRVVQRWDQNLTPGYGPGIVKITGINAP